MPESSDQKVKDNHFHIGHLQSDLGGRAVRGGAIALASQAVKFALGIGSTIILARLLVPADFGLIAMVTVVTGFLALFKDLGLSMATIQRQEINHDQVSTLFWINVAISVLMVAIVISLAPSLALFYDEPRLRWITVVLAGTFLFGGLTVQHQALLRRQMRFKVLAVIEIISLSAGIAIAIAAAYLGTGYWALVAMPVTNVIVNTALVWTLCSWRPGWPRRGVGSRSMLAFGGHLTGFNILKYCSSEADNLLIGWRWGADALGLYSKAYGLLMLPLRQINIPLRSVAATTLSRLQDDPERFKQYYCRAVNLVVHSTLPLVVFLMVLSEEVITLVLGDNWLGMIPIFQILAISGIFQPLFNTVGWVYIAFGRTQRMIKWGLITTPIRIVSYIIGLPWGPVGVATAHAICTVVLVMPGLMYAYHNTPIRVSDVVNAIRRPVALSFVLCLVIYMIRDACDLQHPGFVVMVSLLGSLAYAVFAFASWPGLRREVTIVVSSLQSRL